MDESALEKYFDTFIANDSWSMEEKDELNEDFFSLLPNELLTLHDFSRADPDETRQASEGETIKSPDYSSQNSTAAGGSPVPEPGNLVCPMLPVRPVMELPQTAPQIQNVMSTARLGCPLDLNLIASKAWNVQYNPKIFRALIMRIRKPRATASIYKNGCIVCTGPKSEEQSRVAMRRFARILQKLGFPVCLFKIKIHNVVASYRTFPVSLERLALAHHQHCSYEPELFPALFYTVKPGVTVNIWPSGKICICGAKTRAEVYEVFDTIFPVLSRFRSHRESSTAPAQFKYFFNVRK